jgi:hypothetical protein
MLLCSTHHTLVHEGGFRIEKDYRDRWFFRRPDGRAVPACGYRPEDVTDDGARTAVEYFNDNPSAEGWAVNEPGPDAYAAAGELAQLVPRRKHGNTKISTLRIPPRTDSASTRLPQGECRSRYRFAEVLSAT